MADNPSSIYLTNGLDDLVVSLPESNGELKETSDEDPFDIDVLIRKLEAYKVLVEDAQAQIQRRWSVYSREVFNDTTAARLELRLDGRPAVSSELHDDLVLTSRSVPALPSGASSNASLSSKASHFDPITPESYEDVAVAVASSTNSETWKSSHSSVLTLDDKEETNEVSTSSRVNPQSPDRPMREMQTSKASPIKLLESDSEVSSPMASPAVAVSDRLAIPPSIGSLTMSVSGEGLRKSIEDMSIYPSDEDRAQTEIEPYTIKKWVSKDVKQLDVTALSEGPTQMQNMPPNWLDEDFRPLHRTERSYQPLSPSECRKTTFREKLRNLLHWRSKTEKDHCVIL